MPKKIGVYLWKAFVATLFLGFSALALFLAYGYQYDFNKRDFRKTSIIDIASKEKDVSVALDGTQQAEDLPFQMKGILPGEHVLEVKKKDYQPWKRSVEVAGDVVSIVNDVLLVPVDVEKMVRPLAGFTVSGGEVFTADDYLLEVDPDGKLLKLTSLFDDGTSKSEEIELFKKGISTVEPVADENFLLYFKDGGISWVSFRDKRFVYFKLPAGAGTVKVNPARETVYFLKDGGLYGVPFGKSEEMALDYEKYLVIKRVEAYVPASGGDIYFISGGMLYKSDFQGREKKLVDYAPDFYKNVDFLEGNNNGALVLRDRADKRYLVLEGDGGRLFYLAGDLRGKPRFNGDGQLLYALESGDVFFYDPQLAKKMAVVKIDGDFDILGWFSDRGHFLIREEGVVKLRDVFNANTYTLLAGTENMSSLFTLKGSLFFMRDDALNVLTWNDGK
jgi:hypothetical protein